MSVIFEVPELTSKSSIGTQKDNMDDKISKGRHPAGSNHKNSKLNECQVKLLRRLARRHRQSELAKMFSLSRSTVNRIVNNNAWKHV